MHNVSNTTILDWKKKTIIHIDQFNTKVGNFGVTSIEGLINGNIVLSSYNNVNLDEISEKYSMINKSKSDMVDCSIINISKSQEYFAHKFEEICKKTDEELFELSMKSYDYYVQFMSPQVVTKYFEKCIL